MGDADGDGSERRALLEAAMGKAGQTNCTLLTAGRFLTGGDGWGGAQGNWAVRALPYLLPAPQGWVARWILSTLKR